MFPPFDSHALIARVRAGDSEALAEAYRITFGHELGRLVLADVAQQAGIGGKYMGAPDPYSIGHHQGGHDLAVDLLNSAGFDQASAIAMTMTGQLEGRDDEQSALPFAEPDPDFADDG